MDIISIISLVIVAIVVYYLVKLIPSLVRVIISIIALLVVLYLLKYFFGIQLFDILMKYINPGNWNSGFGRIAGLINYYIRWVESFLRSIISKVPAPAPLQ